MKRATVLVVVGVAVAALAAWLALGPANETRPTDAKSRVSVTPPARYPEHPDAALDAQLRAITSRAPARCGVVVKHLGTGAVARVNADERVPLMSVVKLPVAIVVLDGVDQGRWSLSTPVTLEAACPSRHGMGR